MGFKEFLNITNNKINDIKKGNVSLITVFFFKKHIVATSIIFLLSFSYVAIKIDNMLKKEKIIALKQELNSARTESVRACADYKKQVREARMVSLVDSMKLKLSIPDQPPFKIIGK